MFKPASLSEKDIAPAVKTALLQSMSLAEESALSLAGFKVVLRHSGAEFIEKFNKNWPQEYISNPTACLALESFARYVAGSCGLTFSGITDIDVIHYGFLYGPKNFTLHETMRTPCGFYVRRFIEMMGLHHKAGTPPARPQGTPVLSRIESFLASPGAS